MGISRRQEEEDHSDAGSGAWRRAWWECLLWAGILLCFWGFLSEWSSVSISFSDPRGGVRVGASPLYCHSQTLTEPRFVPEILIMAGGENVAPIPIENLVKEKIPIVSNAVLVGDRAKFLSILLTLKVTWVCCPCMGRSGRSLCPRVQRA